MTYEERADEFMKELKLLSFKYNIDMFAQIKLIDIEKKDENPPANNK